jgi:hypothetical protein
MLKNYKTGLYGIAMLALVIVGQFFPEYQPFAQKLIDTLVAVGFIVVVKDHDVTGGTR